MYVYKYTYMYNVVIKVKKKGLRPEAREFLGLDRCHPRFWVQ